MDCQGKKTNVELLATSHNMMRPNDQKSQQISDNPSEASSVFNASSLGYNM